MPTAAIDPKLEEQLTQYTSKQLSANRTNQSDERMFTRYLESSRLIRDKYPALYDLLQHMLVIDPVQRYSVRECMHHPFVHEPIPPSCVQVIKNIHQPLVCTVCGVSIKRIDK